MKLNSKEQIELDLLSMDLNIDIGGISFQKVWMPLGNAMFFVCNPNTVYLNKKVLEKYGVWELIDEVEHELVHREQFYRDGMLLYLFKKAYYRLIGNRYEKEAYARQDKIDELKRRI